MRGARGGEVRGEGEGEGGGEGEAEGKGGSEGEGEDEGCFLSQHSPNTMPSGA